MSKINLSLKSILIASTSSLFLVSATNVGNIGDSNKLGALPPTSQLKFNPVPGQFNMNAASNPASFSAKTGTVAYAFGKIWIGTPQAGLWSAPSTDMTKLAKVNNTGISDLKNIWSVTYIGNNLIIGTASTGIWYTNDGVNFTQYITGTYDDTGIAACITEINGMIYIGGNGYICVTPAATFGKVSPQVLLTTELKGSGYIWDIKVNQSDKNQLWITTASKAVGLVTLNGKIPNSQSTIKWITLPNNITSAFYVLQVPGNNNVYFATGTGLLRTEDSGNTFSFVNIGNLNPANLYVYNVQIAFNNQMVVETNQGIWVSNLNNGLPNNFYMLNLANNGLPINAGGGFVWKTPNTNNYFIGNTSLNSQWNLYQSINNVQGQILTPKNIAWLLVTLTIFSEILVVLIAYAVYCTVLKHKKNKSSI